MEALLGAVAGALMGYGAARLHRVFDGGWWLSVPLGGAGGALAATWFTTALSEPLADSRAAGAMVAGALGGLVCGALSGAVRSLLPNRD